MSRWTCAQYWLMRVVWTTSACLAGNFRNVMAQSEILRCQRFDWKRHHGRPIGANSELESDPYVTELDEHRHPYGALFERIHRLIYLLILLGLQAQGS